MISLSITDYSFIVSAALLMLLAAWLGSRKKQNSETDYLLSGKKVGLFAFVLANVAAWYGGILGIGEFTYSSGLLSWVTQGLPYYICAVLYAIFLAQKIRSGTGNTIPEQFLFMYGNKAAIAGAVIVFLLVNPAPYLLMASEIIQLFLPVSPLVAIAIILIPLILYLMKGGYRANLYADVFLFFVMFGGFIVGVAFLISEFGGYSFIAAHVPADHLTFTGGAPPAYILVWFFIALWTFADPGFHQRTLAARSPSVARYGILISVILWAVFDFLTLTTGLFSRALLPQLENPVRSFPELAAVVFPHGIKGLFLASLFATVISTLNSFLFLGGVTFGKDILIASQSRFAESVQSSKPAIGKGLIVTGILSTVLALTIPSVITLWYLIGSIAIPGILYPVLGAYIRRFRLQESLVLFQMIGAPLAGLIWHILRVNAQLAESILVIEPMIVGLVFSTAVQIVGIIKKKPE